MFSSVYLFLIARKWSKLIWFFNFYTFFWIFIWFDLLKKYIFFT
jgi:hypothetical protein